MQSPKGGQGTWALSALHGRGPGGDILAGGAVLSFGSDWSVVTLNPWPAVQMLLTRETTEGTPAGGWIPKERLTL